MQEDSNYKNEELLHDEWQMVCGNNQKFSGKKMDKLESYSCLVLPFLLQPTGMEITMISILVASCPSWQLLYKIIFSTNEALCLNGKILSIWPGLYVQLYVVQVDHLNKYITIQDKTLFRHSKIVSSQDKRNWEFTYSIYWFAHLPCGSLMERRVKPFYWS